MKPTVYLRTHFIDDQQWGATFVYRTMRGVQNAIRKAHKFYKAGNQFFNVMCQMREDNDLERDVICRIYYTDEAGRLHMHKFTKQTTED